MQLPGKYKENFYVTSEGPSSGRLHVKREMAGVFYHVKRDPNSLLFITALLHVTYLGMLTTDVGSGLKFVQNFHPTWASYIVAVGPTRL
jgi:hypothetical protein